jgi:tRNA/tmRNA/rRNA uracil-C5-methylase (TrmA/RlmC/RlmD family)
MQEIPTSMRIKNKCPAFRTVGVSHFQMMKARKQTTKTKPIILSAKMKQGQKPELKSVVSGVGTVKKKIIIE